MELQWKWSCPAEYYWYYRVFPVQIQIAEELFELADLVDFVVVEVAEHREEEDLFHCSRSGLTSCWLSCYWNFACSNLC